MFPKRLRKLLTQQSFGLSLISLVSDLLQQSQNKRFGPNMMLVKAGDKVNSGKWRNAWRAPFTLTKRRTKVANMNCGKILRPNQILNAINLERVNVSMLSLQ